MELQRISSLLIVAPLLFMATIAAAAACSNRACKLLDDCKSDGDCEAGLYCFSCPQGFKGSKCVRSTATPVFKLMNNSLPFNKYSFLTTHNAFAIANGTTRLTPTNQEDTVTQQLNNEVRALMLDTYDFNNTVWLCHSFGGKCHKTTKFGPVINTLKEIEAFLSSNTKEIVTIILEDYVKAPNGLTKVFTDSGLKKYCFPVTSMPKGGKDWPLVSDMVAKNQRLLVFGSIKSKEQSEGIAYQWNYMVENQYGDSGMKAGACSNRKESSPMNDKTKSLVLVNYFHTLSSKKSACKQNNGGLLNVTKTCYKDSGSRWANFLAVDFYKICKTKSRIEFFYTFDGILFLNLKRSEGGGTFLATDLLNGELLCGCNDIHACVPKGGKCTR